MLAFVSAMPHPANCASDKRRSRLLNDTLRAMLRQRDTDIRVFVIANAPSQCPLPDDPRLEVVIVPYEPTRTPAGDLARPGSLHEEGTLQKILEDKGAKLALGTSFALRNGARHVMFVDSDDYVHRDIASVVNAQPDGFGWFSDAGYFHVRSQRFVTLFEHDFHQRNGSSHVIRADLLDIPADLSAQTPRDEILERAGAAKVEQIMARHRPVVQWFADRGTPLTPFPMPAAIWEIGTGENSSGALGTVKGRVPVAGAISDDFGLAVPTWLETTWSKVAITGTRIVVRIGATGSRRRRSKPGSRR